MNTTGRIKERKNKKSARLGRAPLRLLRAAVYAVLFIFALVTASCQSFFGTYPFGLTVVSAVSGLFGTASALLGAALGSLLSSAEYGGYLALLAGLLFAARLTVSWWLRQSEAPRRQQRLPPAGGKGLPPDSREAPLLPRRGVRQIAAPGKFAASIRDTGQGDGDGLCAAAHRRLDYRVLADRLRNADGTLLRENVVVRMAMGAIAVMFMGVLSAAEGGFSYYSLFGAIVSVLLSPITVYMIYGATERHMRTSGVREAGLYAMAAVFTYALSSLSPADFDFGYCFAFAASLMAATSYGTVRGVVTGLLCGILLEPLYAPLFALSAGVCGLLAGISTRLAVMSALSCGIAWGIYVAGFDSLAVIVPPLALSASVLLPLYHFDLVRLPENLFGLSKNCKEAEHGTLAEVMHRNTARHLTALSGNMKSIAKMVYGLAGRLGKPTQCELRELCEDAFERYCTRCAQYPTCYGVSYEKTAALIGKIAEALYASGTASANLIPGDFVKKCCSMGRILDEVNFQSARRYAALSSEDKLSVVAGDYEMMGELLGECLDYDKNEMKEDAELTARLTRLLAYHDFRAGRVTAYGVRHKRIFVNDIDLSGVRLGADDIRRLFEGLCGFPLSQPEFEIDGSVLSMRLQSVYRYGAECGRASMAASDLPRTDFGASAPEDGEAAMAVEEVILGHDIGEAYEKTVSEAQASADACPSETEEWIVEEEITVEVTDTPPAEPSGDIISSFEADGRYYMLISDGMGSGREAALTSSVAAMFLERMLTSGASMETSLKMLNKLIRACSRECSATIDLAEIDLNTGEAKFIKSGAAPSFVIRDGSIYRLQSKTIPIGIIRALDAEMIRFDIAEGDVIVMLSDGVARSFEECPWLLDMLTTDREVLAGDVGRAAEKIVRQAAARGASDDITAGVIRIRRGGTHSAA